MDLSEKISEKCIVSNNGIFRVSKRIVDPESRGKCPVNNIRDVGEEKNDQAEWRR